MKAAVFWQPLFIVFRGYVYMFIEIQISNLYKKGVAKTATP